MAPYRRAGYRRIAFPALICAIGIGACGGAQNESSTSSHAGPASRAAPVRHAVSRCASSQLKLTYVNTQGATGHLEVTFALRDVSRQTCVLQGYPGAQLLDAAGHPLITHVQRGGGFFPDSQSAPRAVRLTPGASAQFGLSFADNNEYFRGRPCPAASTLASVPPNARRRLRVSLTGAGRPKFAPCGGQLVASPVYVT